MYRYAAKSTDEIRTARLQLIRGLENPRVNAVAKERMRVWITEAEQELTMRFQDEQAPVAKQESPALWEMRAGVREPQSVHDRERLAWSYWS